MEANFLNLTTEKKKELITLLRDSVEKDEVKHIDFNSIHDIAKKLADDCHDEFNKSYGDADMANIASAKLLIIDTEGLVMDSIFGSDEEVKNVEAEQIYWSWFTNHRKEKTLDEYTEYLFNTINSLAADYGDE